MKHEFYWLSERGKVMKMKWYDYVLLVINVVLRLFFELGTIPMAFIFMGWKIGLIFLFAYGVFSLISVRFIKFRK